MWVPRIPLLDFVHIYSNTTSDMTESQNNIAYTIMRCLTAPNAIRKSLGKTHKYEVDEILICRLCKKTNNVNISFYYRFRVVSISKNSSTSPG